MEEAHREHKDVPFGWVQWLREFMKAQALARPERGYLFMGGAGSLGRPDDTYNLIRTALRPRM
jgi:hypothetical protein